MERQKYYSPREERKQKRDAIKMIALGFLAIAIIALMAEYHKEIIEWANALYLDLTNLLQQCYIQITGWFKEITEWFKTVY